MIHRDYRDIPKLDISLWLSLGPPVVFLYIDILKYVKMLLAF